MRYAVVLGEALVDLFEAEVAGESVFRPMVGGAPLNVAAGLARLGAPVQFVGSVSADVLGTRIRALLERLGVGTRGCPTVDVPTTLAVTTLRGNQPEFHFYGEPPSYAMLGPADLEQGLIAGAGALYCGSIALLRPEPLAAARAAWAIPGPLRALDPNVRPALLDDPAGLRAVVEEFAATADLVKLSEPDAELLFGLAPRSAAAYLRGVGAAAVVVTRGAAGALAAVGEAVLDVPAPEVSAVDTTGAGDAMMAALMYGLLDAGPPSEANGWRPLVEFAVCAASLACERAGGATAMPTLAEVRARCAGGRP